MPVSVAAKVGVSPDTGLLKASRRVIVIVEVATPLATILLVPVMFEFAATGVPAVKVTVPSVLLTGAVMASVFTSAVSDERVQVDKPELSVAEHAP